jgi:hypothetical protein
VEPFPFFALTPEETAHSGVSYEDGVLRLRATRLLRIGSAIQIAVGIVFAIFSASLGLFFASTLFVGVGLALSVIAIVSLRGEVVCSPDGLSLRWFRTRRFAWSRVDHFERVRRTAWWTGRFWPPAELVEADLRDSTRVPLWPTRDIPEGQRGAKNPNTPMIERALLQRYRDTFAKP